MERIRYHVPEDGDDAAHPNVFELVSEGAVRVGTAAAGACATAGGAAGGALGAAAATGACRPRGGPPPRPSASCRSRFSLSTVV